MSNMGTCCRILFLAVAALTGVDGSAAGSDPSPPGGRSGLYFNPAELVALKAKLAHPPFAERRRRLIANADSLVNLTPSEVMAQFRGYDARTSLGVTSVCAFAYAVTGDIRYAERAKREAWSALAKERWFTPKEWNKGAELDTAEYSVACALCYDWCYDTFTPAERRDFARKLLELGVKPYLQSIETYQDWWVDNTVSNWAGVCHGGCGLAALLLSDEFPEAKKACAYAREHLPRFLDQVIGVDGGSHEGVMYWRYGVEFALYFATAERHRSPGEDLDRLFAGFSSKLAGYWSIALQGPDGRWANFNDMDEVITDDPLDYEGGPCAPLCAFFESLVPPSAAIACDPPAAGVGDPLLLWGADHGGDFYYFRGTPPFWFIWRRDVPMAGDKPALPEAMLFRDCGHTLWQSRDLWLAFNGGWISDKSHHHFDLGSFVLVYKGERFIADLGYGYTHTSDHSTVVIDGKDQLRGAQATYLAWQTSRDYDYLICDLSKCYGANVEKFHRHLVLIGGKILVIVDDLRSSGRLSYEWRLPTRLATKADGRTATITGGQSWLHVVSARPQESVVTTGPGNPQRDPGIPRNPHTGHDGAINYVSIKPGPVQAAEVFMTVLYPDGAGSPPPAVAVKPTSTGVSLVITGDNGSATVEFTHDIDWRLTSLNGVPIAARSMPVERTFSRLQH
jgi:hypothetical protein